jgi:hypothetical protein
MRERTRNILIFSSLGAIVLVLLALNLRKKKLKPLTVSGEYKGSNCDELHAFENTNGRVIGGMNTKVQAELERLYKEGYNPEVTEVNVDMNSKAMTVKWSVKIEESKDGNAWVGITSRGSSGNDAFTRAVSAKVGQDYLSIKKKTETKHGEPNIEMKQVKDLLYNLDKNGKPLGGCPTRQVFYVFTKPNKFPKHK